MRVTTVQNPYERRRLKSMRLGDSLEVVSVESQCDFSPRVVPTEQRRGRQILKIDTLLVAIRVSAATRTDQPATLLWECSHRNRAPPPGPEQDDRGVESSLTGQVDERNVAMKTAMYWTLTH